MITHEISINLPRDKLVVMATLCGLGGPWVRIIGTRFRVSPGIPCLVCHMSSGRGRAAYHTHPRLKGLLRTDTTSSERQEHWSLEVARDGVRRRFLQTRCIVPRRSSIMCDSVPEAPMQMMANDSSRRIRCLLYFVHHIESLSLQVTQPGILKAIRR